MDIKSLILDENELSSNKAENKEHVVNKAVYNIDADSGCDFAITKTKGRSVSQLVCLISQKQFYMVVNKTKHVFTFGKNHELTDASDKRRITTFLNEYDDSLEFSEGSVIYNQIPYKDAESINRFIITMNDPNFLESAKYGDAFIDDNGAWFGLSKTDPAYNLKKYVLDKIIKTSSLNLTKKQALYNNCQNLIWTSACNDKDRYSQVGKTNNTQVLVSLHNPAFTYNRWYGKYADADFFTFILENMGYDNSKYIVDTLFTTYAYEPVVRGWGTRDKQRLTDLNLNFDKCAFCNYIIYNAMSEGWGENYSNFFQTWFDTLEMEKNFYGKVKEKYPKNLATYHQLIAFKYSLKIRSYDQNKFEEVISQYLDYEYAYGDYIIKIPRTSDEIIDEAVGQSNCLRSYIDHVSNGHCCIAFMRRRAEMDTSFVTIEIKPDQTIGQVYAAMNTIPDGEALAFVKRWAKEKKLAYEPIEEAKTKLDKYISAHGEYTKRAVKLEEIN